MLITNYQTGNSLSILNLTFTFQLYTDFGEVYIPSLD